LQRIKLFLLNIEKEGYSKVMLVIARRNLVNARIEVLQKAGIEVNKVAMSSEGLFNWFNIAYLREASPSKEKVYDDVKIEAQALILVDVDSNYSDFIVIRKEKLVYTRNFLIGANHLFDQKERWKEKFVDEVVHSIGLYQNEERDAKIVKMFLGGAARYINDLSDLLSTKIDASIGFIDPLHNVRAHKSVDILKNDTYKIISTSALLGMALDPGSLELDLTSSELRIKRRMEEKRKRVTVTGVLAITIFMVLSILFFMIYYNKSMYLLELKRKIAKVEKDAQEVERMRMCTVLVTRRLDAKKRSINVVHEISQLTPKEIYFTNINIEEEKQTILQGNASAMSNVFEFVTTLENSPFFENVKTTYTTTKKDKEGEYAKFEIICMHEKDEEEFLE